MRNGVKKTVKAMLSKEVEIKQKFYAINSVIDTTTSITGIVTNSQGVQADSHIGDKLNLHYIKLQGIVYSGTKQVTESACRISVIQYRGLSTPAVANIFADSANPVISAFLEDASGIMTVLYDKIFVVNSTLGTYGSVGAQGSVACQGQAVVIRKNIRPSAHLLTYVAGSNSVIDKEIYIVLSGDIVLASNTTPYCYLEATMMYTDM